MEELIKLDINKGIAYITLSRIRQKNALNTELLQGIKGAIEKLNKMSEIKVCIFRSACKGVFSAGADIKERKRMDSVELKKRRLLAQETYQQIENCKKVTIAVVNGKNFGGGIEIVTSCDFIVSSYNAEFCLPEVKWGTLGATQRISRLISKGLAKYYLLTAENISAEEAYRIGLTAVLVQEAELERKVEEVAKKIASYSESSVTLTNKCIDIAHNSSLETGLQFEMQAIETIISQNDWKKGVSSFMKRKREIQ